MGGNKSTVLIIGQNIERQIIEFGERDLLRDEQQRAWLDVKFDNRFLRAKNLQREFSQLHHLERTMSRLDFQVVSTAKDQEFSMRVVLKNGADYKVIRTQEFDDQLWVEPNVEPTILVLLDSVNFSMMALEKIEQYLKEHPAVELVVEYRSDWLKSQIGQWLLRRARLVWADLRSHQTAETDELIWQFKFHEQLLLVNHQTGLSLSNKQRSYKMTSAEYSQLNSLEWLAIALKTLRYQFDMEDALSLMARIGAMISRAHVAARGEEANLTEQANLMMLDKAGSEIELIRGEPDSQRILARTARDLSRDGLIFDLTAEKMPIVKEILRVRGLEKYASAMLLSRSHFSELTKRNGRVMTELGKLVMIGLELPSEKRKLENRPREMVNYAGNDIGFLLDEMKVYRLRVAKFAAEFLLGQELPSDVVLLANVKQLATFAAQAKQRQILPILTIQAVLQANFEPLSRKPGALAAELARILRCLQVEFRTLDLKFEQVMINFELIDNGGQLDASQLIKQQQLIKKYLYDHDLNCPNWSLSTELGQDEFTAAAAAETNNLICNHHSYSRVTATPADSDQLRIKFSQFLAQLSLEM